MKKIKVAVISGFYPGGGVVTYIRNLYSHLNKSKIIKPYLFLDSPNKYYDKLIKSYFPKKMNLKIYRVPETRFLKGVVFLMKLFFKVDFKKFDIVEIHHTAYANALYKFIQKEKLVIVTHGPDVLDNRMNNFVYRNIAKKAYKKSIVIFTHTHKEVEKLISLGIPKEKIIFFPCGVDLYARKKIKITNLRKELKIKNKYVLCTTYGKNYERKGTGFILDALPQLMKEDLAVILTGQMSKEMLPRVKSAIKSYKGRFFWVGFRNDIPNILYNSDIYILPSLMEGMSVSLLEAMAAGKACIATKGVGENEYSIGNAGVLIKPGSSEEIVNAIRRLIKNPRKIKELSKKAKKRAKLFSWEKIVKEEEKFIKKVHNKNDKKIRS